MFKITFEKTIIFILILILLISTTNISKQYIKLLFPDKNTPASSIRTENSKQISFIDLLMDADDSYQAGDYKGAIERYNTILIDHYNDLTSTNNTNLNFKLGVAYYKLGYFDKAYESFIKSAQYDSSVTVAYNNAAVCAYYLNDMTNALLTMQKAIETQSIVEYYFNMGRICESIEDYEQAVKQYIAVIKGEENISAIDKIDPIKLKNKVQNLMLDKSQRDIIANKILIALRYKDSRELLVIEDEDMELKSLEFSMKTENINSQTRLICEYDRKKADPYNLINKIAWVVEKDKKKVYSSSNSSFTYNMPGNGKYEVQLNIIYNGSKVKTSYRNLVINNKEHKIEEVVIEAQPVVVTPIAPKPKTNVYLAQYEQLFEKGFLSSRNYIDSFDVVWGKDDVETKIVTKQYRDSGSSLWIKNTSSTDAGIWANLSPLVDSNGFRGKKISIRFYARKITDTPNLKIAARAGSESAYADLKIFNQWSQQDISLYIPKDVSTLTFSLHISPEEEIEIDGFHIIVLSNIKGR